MRILHLPVNIASQISFTVRGLRALGADVRGLARRQTAIQDYSDIEFMDWFGRTNAASRLTRGIQWRVRMTRMMAWADVIHWHWGDTTWRGLDLRLAAWMRKPRLVEFWGDDLRNPDVAARDNPFIARMYQQNFELNPLRSHQAQRLFARSGFHCLIPGFELSDYVDAELFAGYYQTRACLVLEDYAPHYPDPHNAKPVVVHAPSNKSKKGTEAVLSVMQELAKTHVFEFKLIHQVPRREAIEIMAGCDLFLDQFTIGAEGLASHEAMAMGKPVVCYIKPSLRNRYPPGLPIVIADQNNLKETVASLLNNGQRRRELGQLNREYMAQYHDARKVAAELLEIYRDVLSRARAVPTGPSAPSPYWRPLSSMAHSNPNR